MLWASGLRPSSGLAPASRRATLRAAAAGWLWGSGRLAPASRLAALRAAAAGLRRWVSVVAPPRLAGDGGWFRVGKMLTESQHGLDTAGAKRLEAELG